MQVLSTILFPAEGDEKYKTVITKRFFYGESRWKVAACILGDSIVIGVHNGTLSHTSIIEMALQHFGIKEEPRWRGGGSVEFNADGTPNIFGKSFTLGQVGLTPEIEKLAKQYLSDARKAFLEAARA